MKLQETHPDDAINIAPHFHEVIFEDDAMRVLKVTVNPGDAAEMHWHPRNINYVLSGGRLRFEKPDGSSVIVDLGEEQVTSAGDGSHMVENVGSGTVQTIQVELKPTLQGTDMPAA